MPSEQATDVQKVLAAVRAVPPHASWHDVKDRSGLPEHAVGSALLHSRRPGLSWWNTRMANWSKTCVS